jgi:hypothetical protein
MMEISLWGLIGAMLGTALAALTYGRLIDALESWLKARRSPQEGPMPTTELAMLRRGVLAFDLLLLAGIGYWIGHELGG